MNKVQTTEFWVSPEVLGSLVQEQLQSAFGDQMSPITLKDTELCGSVAAFAIRIREDQPFWAEIFTNVHNAVVGNGYYLHLYTAINDQQKPGVAA